MLTISSNTEERRLALIFHAPEGVTSKAHHAAVKAAMNSISFYAKGGWNLEQFTRDRHGNEGRFSTVCTPQKWLPEGIRMRLLENRADISRVYKNKLKRV